MFTTTPDGLRISYDQQGNGPALLLLQKIVKCGTRWAMSGV